MFHVRFCSRSLRKKALRLPGLYDKFDRVVAYESI